MARAKPEQLDLEEAIARAPRPRFEFLDPSRREIPDDTPIAPPIGYKKQPSMVEIVRNMVRSENLRRAAEAAGAETFEEADDFDTGEEDLALPLSGYEAVFEPPLPPDPPAPAASAAPPGASAAPAPTVPGGSPTAAPEAPGAAPKPSA